MSAIDGIFVTFVGLLLYVCFEFTMTLSWNTVGILLGHAALSALFCKVDILYIVMEVVVIPVVAL